MVTSTRNATNLTTRNLTAIHKRLDAVEATVKRLKSMLAVCDKFGVRDATDLKQRLAFHKKHSDGTSTEA